MGERDPVELRIGDRVFGGWKSIRIDVDLDAGASSFELEVTERWGGQPERWAIDVDQPAIVSIGGEPVITGYVDRLEPELDGDNHTIKVAGRSKTADLVDCSAIATPGSWKGRTIDAIAAELARPFGIGVTATGPAGAPFKRFSLQQGETVWEVIQRLASHRGLLAVTTPAGDVELISPAPSGPSVRVAQGEHILRLAGSHDVTERFSKIIVKGQSAGDDEHNGKAAAGPKAEATDPAVKRHRPLLIIAEEQATVATLQRRAQWEATVRSAKAQEATVTLLDWRREDGSLWMPRQRMDLFAPAVFITAEVMIAGVSFQLDEKGRRVELRCVRPEAYTQLPVPEEAEAARIRGARRRKAKDGSEGDADGSSWREDNPRNRKRRK